jgi:hypothetical protein
MVSKSWKLRFGVCHEKAWMGNPLIAYGAGVLRIIGDMKNVRYT